MLLWSFIIVPKFCSSVLLRMQFWSILPYAVANVRSSISAAVNRKSNHNQTNASRSAALISEAQRTSSMRIPSRARNLARAFRRKYHSSSLHLHLFLSSLSVCLYLRNESTVQPRRKMKNISCIPAISSFVRSFVRSNVFTPASTWRIARHPRAKKRWKKAGKVINDTGWPNDSRVATRKRRRQGEFSWKRFPRETRAAQKQEAASRVESS